MSDNAAARRRPRGQFIVLEGLDGSGLSTQAVLLKDWLVERQVPIYLTKEPTAGPVGALIRLALGERLKLSDSTADNDAVIALLFAADRTDHLATDIIPKLEAGVHVICDRYYLSTFAYQSRSMDLGWLRCLHTRCIAPDLTLLLDVPPAVCVDRIARHRWHVEIYESEAILEGVRERYHSVADVLRSEGQDIRVIAGGDGRTIADIQALILEQVRPFLAL